MGVLNFIANLKFKESGIGKTFGKANKELNKFQKRMKQASKHAKVVGKGLRNIGFAGTAAAVGVGLAIKSHAEFERQMSSVIAKMVDGREHYGALEESAKQMGAATIFTAKEAAQGLEFLALAGFKAQEAIGVLPTLLYTAGAGALELGRASDIITDNMSALKPVMKGFGDRVKQATVLSDMYATVQARTNTNINQLGDAITYGGGAMANMQIPLDEIVSAMGALANAGIKGSSAGTGLTNMMTKLSKPTAKAKSLLADMGLSFSDLETQGENGRKKLKNIADIVSVFEKRLGKNFVSILDKAGATTEIFGKRGQRAFFALANEGSKNLKALQKELRNSAGAAKKQYEVMTDNIFGASKQFQSATSAVFMELGKLISKTFNVKGIIESVTKPIIKLAFAFIALNKPMEEWSEHQKALMDTPIGEFAMGFRHGMVEIKESVVGVVMWIKELLGYVDDGEIIWSKWGNTVAKLIVGLAIVGPILLGILGTLVFLGPIVAGMASTFALIGTVFLAMVSPVGLVVLAVAALVAGGILVYKYWDNILGVFKSIWDWTKKIFMESPTGRVLSWLSGSKKSASATEPTEAGFSPVGPDKIVQASEGINETSSSIRALKSQQSNVSVSTGNNSFNPNIGFEVNNTFDGDEIFTNIKKKERHEANKTGDQFDEILGRKLQPGYGG